MRQAPTIRRARPSDAEAIWRLISASPELDSNSFYCYHLLCSAFGQTCRVAEIAGVIVGCVTAFRPPEQPDVLFVWQLCVDPAARGQGVAGLMLDHLLRSQPASRPVRFVEATVAPENAASQRTFEALARRHDTTVSISTYLAAGAFPAEGGEHPTENLLRVGPLG